MHILQWTPFFSVSWPNISCSHNSITFSSPCLVSLLNFLALRFKQILSTQTMTLIIFDQLPCWICVKMFSLTTFIATNVSAFLICGLVSSSLPIVCHIKFKSVRVWQKFHLFYWQINFMNNQVEEFHTNNSCIQLKPWYG